VALALLVGLAGSASAAPATTAFTYQGRVTAGGVAATANYDFQFKLFDSASAGTQINGTLTVLNVPATGGLFTVQLDFGQAFPSDRRFLEVSVRPAGGGSYTLLTPRQEITAAPHAEGLVLPIVSVTNVTANALDITNNGGNGIVGTSGSGIFEAGLYGFSTTSGGNGVRGNADTGSNAFGVWGNASQGDGVVGAGGTYGGNFSSGAGTGVLGVHSNGTGTSPGAEGDTDSADGFANAVLGHVLPTAPGGFSTAVRGINEGTGGNGIGVWGSQSGSGWGVYGTVGGSGYAVYGNAASASGSVGVNGAGQYGVQGTSNLTGGAGVHGIGGSSNPGVLGESATGGGSSFGVLGTSSASQGNGIQGLCNNGGSAYGVWGISSSGQAGHFDGNVVIVGSISKSSGTFQIDHPLDPANKYLYHSFVESPDMMNIYNGNAQLDNTGSVVITMPDWFEALNTDFRYQLTAMGAPGPNLYIAQPMQNRQFVISGGTPGGGVSWQVTGIRQDPWANAHRVQVETMKTPEERGLFLHPELYGLPPSRSIGVLKGPAYVAAVTSPGPQANMPLAPSPAPGVVATKEGN
jgi:hypothetical protein